MLTPHEISIWTRILRSIRNLKIEDGVAAVAMGVASWGCDLLGMALPTSGVIGLGAGTIFNHCTKAMRFFVKRRLKLSRARRNSITEGGKTKAQGQRPYSDDGPPAR